MSGSPDVAALVGKAGVPVDPEVATMPEPPVARAATMGSRAVSVVRLLWIWAVGAVLCMNPFTALLVVGWSYRLAGRVAVRTWRKEAGLPRQRGRLLPNWVLGDGFPPSLRGARSGSFGVRVRAVGRAFAGSFWPNLVAGWKGFVNSMVLTLPAGMLMMLSWHFGWNNSFNKGYEQAWASLAGIAGLVILILLMGHLVMAQARQAVTGRASAFYHFWKVRRVLWAAPLSVFWLGLLYAVFGLGLIGGAATLIGVYTSNPDIGSASSAEVRSILRTIYFPWCLALFPAFALLKALGGRVYARSVSRLLARGEWSADDLVGDEAEAIAATRRLPGSGGAEEDGALVSSWRRAFRYTGGATWRWPVRAIAAVVLWFPFGAQIYVAQFLVEEPAVRWLRHPLVQLPWFHYVPLHLRDGNGPEEEG